MRLTFIGCGSAFNMKDLQSNMLLEFTRTEYVLEGHNAGEAVPVQHTQRLLIDCGMTAPQALDDLGLTAGDIDALYVSHQHADHIGGIEWLAFVRFFTPNSPKPLLFANEKLVDDLWNHSLKGGLASIEGRICTLDTFFTVKGVEMNDSFDFADVKFTPIQTVHIMNGYGIVPSYGLLFTAPSGKRVFITTDTQFCPHQIANFYKDADIIFQDAETAKYKSGVHAHYDDLKTLPADVRKKMWLYHYQTGEKPNAEADGFAGFVKKGQVFEL
jgi:ribonuclease BN (tRNA processing enzyme)